jgi:hypothetical protein
MALRLAVWAGWLHVGPALGRLLLMLRLMLSLASRTPLCLRIIDGVWSCELDYLTSIIYLAGHFFYLGLIILDELLKI